MKKYTYSALFLISVTLLSGCKPEHDKDWYKAHDAERAEKIAECKKQAEQNQDADCKNAMDAKVEINLYGREGKTKDPAELLKVQ
ncbi:MULTISPECIES: EexN family lipoprotein [Serratia]|uniref:EexN family lipoprotein n=1 Tax=Serratia TaxID=613 RepID=UPI001F4C0291|nr:MULTISPECIES: EexN family lipoprotein [Serratia]ULG13023.1 hypothetical protein 294p2_00017 [Serratia marcescens]